MPSSVIRRFEYNPDTRDLEITFVTGRVYVYADVPAEAHQAFAKAFSKGEFFNRCIRDQYQFREVAPTD
jgi:lysyl-tRNA synthetase class 2